MTSEHKGNIVTSITVSDHRNRWQRMMPRWLGGKHDPYDERLCEEDSWESIKRDRLVQQSPEERDLLKEATS